MKIWTLFEPKHKNLKCQLKIEGSLKKFLNIKRLMSIPSPLQQYHFHVILIWWHSPFKFLIICNSDIKAQISYYACFQQINMKQYLKTPSASTKLIEK
jgi:hypothetical protein